MHYQPPRARQSNHPYRMIDGTFLRFPRLVSSLLSISSPHRLYTKRRVPLPIPTPIPGLEAQT